MMFVAKKQEIVRINRNKYCNYYYYEIKQGLRLD